MPGGRRGARGPDSVELNCYTCKNVLPVAEFGWAVKGKTYHSNCRSCRSTYGKFYHKSVKYGITREEYDQMLGRQNNTCAICGGSFANTTAKTQPHVDHNHVTKKVRGILCHPCNVALGLIKEDKETLRSMIRYLEESEQCQ